MRDPFQRAQAMRQAQGAGVGGNAGVAAPAQPAAPGKGPGPVQLQSSGVGDFHTLAKKFGVDKLKLDHNPVVARTQLMQHLQQKFGAGYMAHPGVRDLLESFNPAGRKPSRTEVNSMDSQATRTVQTLLGG